MMLSQVDRNDGFISIDIRVSLYSSPVFHHQWTEIEIAVMTMMIKLNLTTDRRIARAST